MTLFGGFGQHKRQFEGLICGAYLRRTQLDCKRLFLGNKGALWCVFPDGLTSSNVVYSFGVGEDISFDLELISRFGVRVHAFDPTPRSIQWLGRHSLPEGFEFHPYGVCGSEGSCKLYPPANPNHVSHSRIRRDSPWPAVELPVHRLITIMGMLGHETIDLLKMDIEGAEYEVIADLLACGIRVNQLLVEFHHRWREIGVGKTRTALRKLNQAGFRIFNVSPRGEEYSLLRM